MPAPTNQVKPFEDEILDVKKQSLYARLKRLFSTDVIVRNVGGKQLKIKDTDSIMYATDRNSLRDRFNRIRSTAYNAYTRDFALSYQAARMDLFRDYDCIGPDTIIPLPDGSRPTIKELTEKYKDKPQERFYVFSYDHKTDSIVLGKAFHPRKKKGGTRIGFKVTFDNGQYVIGSIKHPFLMRNGEYKTIYDLKVGDSVMPFYQKDCNKYKHYCIGPIFSLRNFDKKSMRTNMNWFGVTSKIKCGVNHKIKSIESIGPIDVYDVTVEEYHNFATDTCFVKNTMDMDPIVSCLSAGTYVSTTNGYITIKDLSDRYANGEYFKVWSWDKENHKIVIGNAHHPRKSGVKKVIELYLTNGEVLKCTADHKIMMVDETYKEAGKLSVNESIMPDRDPVEVARIVDNNEIIDVYDLTVDVYENFAIKQGIIVSNSALDILADESLTYNEMGKMITVHSNNNNVKRILENLFDEILNVRFNLWSWTRNMLKYGDFYLKLYITPEYGIYMVEPISAYNVERIENSDPSNKRYVKFQLRPTDTSQAEILENYEVAHFRLLSDSSFLPYGKAAIEGGRRVWKQLSLLEDAMLISRIMRAPERRIFYVDIGNIPPNEVDNYIEKMTTKMKRVPYMDEKTGEYNLRFNLQNMLDDYYIPLRGGDSGTKIDTLPGMEWTGIEDLEYVKNKMMAAFKIPKAFLGFDESLCISPDTSIPLLNGTSKTVRELINDHNNGVKNYVYSLDENTKNIVPGEIEWAGFTRMNTNVVRVWLDNGKYVDCTPDHCFMTRDGKWVEAKDLIANQSLMPWVKSDNGFMNNMMSVQVENLPDKIDTCDIRIKSYHTFATDAGVIIHNSGKSTLACVVPETQVPLLSGLTKTVKELIDDYSKGIKNYVYSIDESTKNIVPGEIEWAGFTRMNTEVIRVHLYNNQYIDCTPDHRFMLRDGTWVEAQNLVVGASLMPHETAHNSSVTKIEILNEKRDTCDITIKQHHNFATTAGVIIHNSEDVRFARTIQRIQRIIAAELSKIAIVHLYAQGYRDESLVDFELELTNPSTIFEKEKIEIYQDKVNVATDMVENKFFSYNWVYKNIFNMSEDDIEEVKKEVVDDAKQRYRFTSIEEDGDDPAKPFKKIGGKGGGDEDEHGDLGIGGHKGGGGKLPDLDDLGDEGGEGKDKEGGIDLGKGGDIEDLVKETKEVKDAPDRSDRDQSDRDQTGEKRTPAMPEDPIGALERTAVPKKKSEGKRKSEISHNYEDGSPLALKEQNKPVVDGSMIGSLAEFLKKSHKDTEKELIRENQTSGSKSFMDATNISE